MNFINPNAMKTLLNSFLTLLFLLGFSVILQAQQPIYLYHECSDPANFTINSTYHTNLNTLLSSLSANANNTNGFYNTSVGENPNTVYGLFLCRGDLTSDTCQNFAIFAIQDIVKHCPMKKHAIIWYDVGRLRYSNQSFFSTMSLAPNIILKNTQNVTGRDHFTEVVIALMKDRASEAANDKKKFALGDYGRDTSGPIYFLLQCTQDLSSQSCNSCLSRFIDELRSCCSNSQGGRIMSPSCLVQYEMYPITKSQASPVAPPPASPPPPAEEQESKGKQITIISSVAASILGVILILISACIYIIRRKNLKAVDGDSHELQLLEFGIGDDQTDENILNHGRVDTKDFPIFRIDIISKATNNFSNECKLGAGGFGPVYKGTLEDGKEIAVKRLSETSGQGQKEFMNEVTLIARLQHRNLVRLLGCCIERNEKLLVYEYMPNKSLDVFLFDSSLCAQLDWQRRLHIINGIARGIMYLHEDSRLRIVHRDLKVSNILLDSEMNPKISDFGMARIFAGNGNDVNTNRIVGTYGYMAPEYALEGLFSAKSDVFSFGVLLLEIISGKRNTGFYLRAEGETLITFTWKLWTQGRGMELLEPLIVDSGVETEVRKGIHIGLLCVQDNPAERPTMSSVVVMLSSDIMTLPQPKEPTFSVGQFVERSDSSSNPEVSSIDDSSVVPHYLKF